jgi:pimeloyl-ACP methyl ester carboxylesterase
MAVIFGALPIHVPGGDLDPAVRFARVRIKNGIELYYAEQGPARGPAIVMLHGFTDSWFSFSRVLPLLPKDLRVIVPDQRGHGRSDRPGRYAIEDLAGDIVDLMDALQVPQATVVGHSMGSFVARAVALSAPARVSGLVLMGSAPVPGNSGMKALQHEIAGLTDPVDEAFVRAFQEGCIALPVPGEFMNRVIAESRLLPVEVWKGGVAGLVGYEQDAAGLRVRTLILGGEKDAVFSIEEHQALARRIPGAAIDLSRDVGHTPHWETPEAFVRKLLGFVSRSEK